MKRKTLLDESGAICLALSCSFISGIGIQSGKIMAGCSFFVASIFFYFYWAYIDAVTKE